MYLLEDHPSDSIREDADLRAFKQQLQSFILAFYAWICQDNQCLEVAPKCLDLIRIHPRVRSDPILQVKQLVLRPFFLQFLANLNITASITIT